MSEAELHILKERMYQGRLNKARRGELFGPPPIGYIAQPSGEPAIDPDEQVQAVVRQGSLSGPQAKRVFRRAIDDWCDARLPRVRVLEHP